jgi:multisubunit Na+/H+ antiporter MnhC subunit
MLFAAAATAKTSTFSGFDPFVIIFTLVIAIGFLRLLSAKKKNKFAIGFSFIALAVFAVMSVVAVSGW